MAYVGGIVAASNAAAERRRRELRAAEEESMTDYTRDDIREDWEFKIVRSESGAFRRPEVLERLIEEEAQAGWVMLEKFDDNRVRFKRPRSARARDDFLPDGFDPYRTQYGRLSARPAMLVGVLIGLLALFGLGGILLARSPGISLGPAEFLIMTPLILILLGFFFVVWKARGMR